MDGLGLGFDSAQSRHEKSLGLLTTRFVKLLQESPDGVLDLKQVSTSLMGVTHRTALHGHACLCQCKCSAFSGVLATS